MQKALKEIRPHREKTTLLHDNARPHTAKKTREKLTELNWNVLSHPPYSPDLAPTDFKLFRSMQNSLRGKEFRSVEEVEEFIRESIASKSSGFFVKGFTQLVERWREVIDREGEY